MKGEVRHSWKKGIAAVGFEKQKKFPRLSEERKNLKARKKARTLWDLGGALKLRDRLEGQAAAAELAWPGQSEERWRFYANPALLCRRLASSGKGREWDQRGPSVWHLPSGCPHTSQRVAWGFPDVAVCRGVGHLPFLGFVFTI